MQQIRRPSKRKQYLSVSLLFGWILPRVPSVWVKINHIYQSKKLHTSEATYMYISRRSSINQKLHTSDIEAPYIRSYIHVHQSKKLHTSDIEATYIRSYIHQKLHTCRSIKEVSYIRHRNSKKRNSCRFKFVIPPSLKTY